MCRDDAVERHRVSFSGSFQPKYPNSILGNSTELRQTGTEVSAVLIFGTMLRSSERKLVLDKRDLESECKPE